MQSREGLPGRHKSASMRGGGGSRGQAAREGLHICPWCGSADTDHVQRGFVGATDERNQYLECHNCDRLTFEIISKTVRDMRVGQFRVGGTYRDPLRQVKYTITRVLKVGMNECLLYVKPVIRAGSESETDRD